MSTHPVDGPLPLGRSLVPSEQPVFTVSAAEGDSPLTASSAPAKRAHGVSFQPSSHVAVYEDESSDQYAQHDQYDSHNERNHLSPSDYSPVSTHFYSMADEDAMSDLELGVTKTAGKALGIDPGAATTAIGLPSAPSTLVDYQPKDALKESNSGQVMSIPSSPVRTSGEHNEKALVGSAPVNNLPAGPHNAHNPNLPPIPLGRFKFVVVFGSLMICVFLFALDQLIISTAIPKIVSQFDSLTQVAWLSNGFFLTLAGFTLLYGQMLALFPSKYILLIAIFIFEAGSLICGVAPGMVVLIVGRAVAGLGAGGIFSSAFQITVELTTLAERPIYMALFGACFGLSSVLGPLIGGVLTDHVSWRWCFYINLPIGAVAFVLITLLFKAAPALGAGNDSRTFMRKILGLDWVGTAITIAHTACISLAFQYGGVDYAWGNARVIVLLIMIPVTLAIFCAWTLYIGPEKAMFPIRFLRRRVIIGASLTGFFGWMTFMAVVYYLSITFQAIYGTSATKAGVDLLSMIVVQTVLIVMIGRVVAKTGHYKYLICFGPLPIMLGCGLIYWTIDGGRGHNYILGFQTLIGVGVAAFLQNIIIAGQVEFRNEPRFISRAIGIITFIGFIGRIVGVSVATSIFNNLIIFKLDKYAPTMPKAYQSIVRDSVAAIRTVVPEVYRADVIVAYSKSIAPVFIYGVVASFCCFCCSWLLKNDSLILPQVPTQPAIPSAKEDEENRMPRTSFSSSTLYATETGTEGQEKEKQKRQRDLSGDSSVVSATCCPE
ncbi:Predicted transporter (major facilitator superfamily) [Phaffia rhodozyma]|uniref:Predicted transporter (Major facilitator superfamily) n=1 Tax=Phaffia rhodozyma TaxID=264483 RepID=A0A0F7SP39_PHARH|nr:Predicted transporter (major facilitator superfamily) [Phaffia rhodozyma]